jgi:hypothetical protein
MLMWKGRPSPCPGGEIVNALDLDLVSAPDGTVSLRLPEPGRFRVHVKVTWEPAEPDRKAIFEEVRRRGHPDAVALIDRLGEDAIENPAGLLLWASIDDPSFDRPPQPPLEDREIVE